MSVIIPDSIEPYYGYKALKMVGTDLVSPSQPTTWPKKAPLEAACNAINTQPRFRWKLVAAPEGWEGQFWVPAHFLTEGSTTTFAWPPNDPPEGFTWRPEPAPHDISKCTCGIYAVDSVVQTRQYLEGTDRVIVYVAIWGQIIRGAKGARGQYAYPQKIYAAEQQTAARRIAYEYDIPIEIVTFFAE